jgi:hypothetical protein
VAVTLTLSRDALEDFLEALPSVRDALGETSAAVIEVAKRGPSMAERRAAREAKAERKAAERRTRETIQQAIRDGGMVEAARQAARARGLRGKAAIAAAAAECNMTGLRAESLARLYRNDQKRRRYRRIEALANQGRTRADIARIVGVAPDTVAKVLSRVGGGHG